MVMIFSRGRGRWFQLAVLFSVLSLPVLGQSRFTLSGTVRNDGGEALPGASVAVPALATGTAADSLGHFSISLPAGTHQLLITSIGYKAQNRSVVLNKNLRLALNLQTSTNELAEVVVDATRESLEKKLKSTQMGVEHLSIREAKLLPALFGEVDILKTLQLKPGVQSGGEGTTGLFVRGGSSDQNLVLLDNTLVYNPNHLFGLFSVFNSDAVSSVDLYKSGFPAQFGGRLSSVVDVKLREGSREKFTVTGGIGVISSRLTLEGPISKGRGSFIISGRRTYFDIFTRAINKANEKKADYSPIPDYYFYDTNAKANYTLGAKDQLFLTAYLGRDIFGFSSPGSFNFSFTWGNTLANLRWQHVFSPKLLVNTSLAATDYKYDLTNKLDIFSFNLGSKVRDYTLRTDFEYLPNDRHTLKFGALVTQHVFGVGRLQAGSSDNSINFGNDVSYTGTEAALYGGDNFKASDKWQLEGGVRLTGFRSGDDQNGGVEPRASARYLLSDKISFKGSYALMYQYVHLVTNSGATLPTDIWYPSRLSVKPQRSQQVSAGGSFLLGQGKYLLTNEVYYKWGQNQVDFRDGAQLFVNPNLDQEFIFGRSWSYGNELYLEKKTGRTTGWVGYTLAWAWRNFQPQNGTNGVNRGEDFHPTYDRRHNLTVVVIHELSPRISLTASYIFTSGNLATLPLGRFYNQDIPGSAAANGNDPRPYPVYPDRNSYRLIAYSRLDLGMVYKIGSRRNQDLTFSIYNATNRRNAYFITFDTVRDKATDRITGYQARQVSLFPLIPSVTYNFKF